MQSLFPIHWIRDPVREKQTTLDKVHMYQPSCVKPSLDLNFLANPKRKREGSVGAPLPGVTVPQQKRLRTSENDGAVRPVSQPAREVSSTVSEPVAPMGKHTVHMSSASVEPSRGSENGLAAKYDSRPIASGTGQQVLEFADQPMGNASPLVSVVGADAAPLGIREQADVVLPETSSVDSTGPAIVSIESNLDQVRSVIAAQIDLEILLKHNELRLIEQELAKCQVALEQIRRCELMPYPGSQGISMDVASGTGPALAPPHGYTTPQYPAAFGVTDGPYTKHYAQWLLPDAAFDPQAIVAPTSAVSAVPLSGRSTRGFAADFHLPPTPIGRGSRVSSGTKSQLLGQDASQPYRDPLLMKREMDGQWVRLVCTKCKPERANFQNIQGFLNHCRISHQDNYKSHEQAAIACGRPVDIDESNMPPPPPPTGVSKHKVLLPPVNADVPTLHRTMSASTPTVERPSERLSSTFNSLTTIGSVNGGQSALRKLVLPRAFDPNPPSLVSTPNIESPASPFAVSPQTPHLSELLKRQRFAFDLNAAVAEAKTKVDTSVYDCSDSENEHGSAGKRNKQKKSGSSSSSAPRRPPVGRRKSGEKTGKAKAESAVPLSHQTTFQLTSTPKQHTAGPLKPVLAPSLSSSTIQQHTSDQATPVSLSDADHDDMELSPGTAADSNPGLVSDHEGESDDADEEAVADPVSSQSFQKGPAIVAHRRAGGVRSQTFSVSSGDMMDIDNYVEIQDASDGERDPSGVRVREGPNVEVTCSSRPGTAN